MILQLEFAGTQPGVLYSVREIVKGAICLGIVYFFLHKEATIALNVTNLKFELALGFAAVGLAIAVGYAYWSLPTILFPPSWVTPIYNALGFDLNALWNVFALATIPIVVLLVGRYSWRDAGIGVPAPKNLLTWLIAFAVTVALAALLAMTYGEDFLQPYFSNLFSWETPKWLLLAYLPEELLFRVYLQTRLEKVANPSWAIIITAVLFNLLHAPMQLISSGWNGPSIAANVLLPVNGLIGGYVWHKTRNLPVVLFYHMTIYQL